MLGAMWNAHLCSVGGENGAPLSGRLKANAVLFAQMKKTERSIPGKWQRGQSRDRKLKGRHLLTLRPFDGCRLALQLLHVFTLSQLNDGVN